MNTRNKKILSGIITVFLAMTLATSAIAQDVPGEAEMEGLAPRIYLVKKCVDIGTNKVDGQEAGWNCEVWEDVPGQDGTINPTEFRSGNYAFNGEQIVEYVVVRDLNGAIDIDGAYVKVEDTLEVPCQEVTPLTDPFLSHADSVIEEWVPAPSEFDPTYDKAFKCYVVVEAGWSGPSVLTITAFDFEGNEPERENLEQLWDFNPEMDVDVRTSDGAPIDFMGTRPNDVVASSNQLYIENLGVVDVVPYISADDFEDVSGPSWCYDSGDIVNNKIEVNEEMDYRARKGTYFGTWIDMPNPNLEGGCHFDNDDDKCQGAKLLFHNMESDYFPFGDILRRGDLSQVEFKLRYEDICYGHFEGPIHVLLRAL